MVNRNGYIAVLLHFVAAQVDTIIGKKKWIGTKQTDDRVNACLLSAQIRLLDWISRC